VLEAACRLASSQRADRQPLLVERTPEKAVELVVTIKTRRGLYKQLKTLLLEKRLP